MSMSEAYRDPPRVLIIKPPVSLSVLGDRFFASTDFQILKAFESPLPLSDYIAGVSDSISVVVAPVHGPVTADLIRLLPDLRLVATTSAGVDHVDLVECRLRGISVSSVGTIFSEDVADTAIGLLIDVFRRVSAANRFVIQGLWPVKGDYPLGSKLGKKRIGIVGMGSIGLKIVTRLKAFGCQISYTSKSQKPYLSHTFYIDIVEMAANCDALILCCALNDQTWHLINKDVLSALGKQGVIINVARGSVIDEKELVKFLSKGEIAGAGLDVFEDEPNVPKELFELDNVVMSPHSANKTLEAVEESEKILAKNIEAFFSDKPLLNPVLDCRQQFTYVSSC